VTPRSLHAPARLARQPILSSQSDERLVDLVRAGCDPAFEAIVARYRRPLLRYCSRLLPEERAEDAVQQAFINAYRSIKHSPAELDLRPWLYRIAHNAALDCLRDLALRYERLSEHWDGVERPDQVVERRQGVREVLAAVQRLPDRQRDAIVLRALEGRSYEEIALELGVTGGAVRQLLNRARLTLRAGAAAVTPGWLLARLPWGGEGPVTARIAELCGGVGAGAAVTKVCATALVTGAVVGGVAVLPRGRDEPSGTLPAAQTPHRSDQGAEATGIVAESGGRASETGLEDGGRHQGDGDAHSRAGHEDGERSGPSERSGRGSEGFGSVSERSRVGERSGSSDMESSDSRSSGSGSGPGSSGSDSPESGSGSSTTSGPSTSSGPESRDPGSVSSGSGSSGSEDLLHSGSESGETG
jgi:RNA polymerase sigma factor (sigma-70 family)